MKVCILGDNGSARTIAGRLAKTLDVVPHPAKADHTLYVDISHTSNDVLFDSVDGEVERNIHRCVRTLHPGRVIIDTHGGAVHDPRVCRIVMPMDDEIRAKVEIGVHRGFLDLMNNVDGRRLRPSVTPLRKQTWWERWKARWARLAAAWPDPQDFEG